MPRGKEGVLADVCLPLYFFLAFESYRQRLQPLEIVPSESVTKLDAIHCTFAELTDPNVARG